ncbi:MAG: ABC transporter permease [Ruminococcus sp.]|nr:ABC transporter permease [Ruminococcus sp.]
MFRHNLKYSLLAGLRVRQVIIWLLIFPIALGIMFKVAFGGIYEKQDLFTTFNAAVVMPNGENSTLRSVLDSIENGDDPMMKFTYTDAENAGKLLCDEKIEGIITDTGTELTLEVAGNGMNETILKAFCDRYNANVRIITEAAQNDPASVPAVTAALMQDIDTVNTEDLSVGNMNYYDEYFYNLLAMVALFGALTGLTVAVDNQANLSALGARKNCSPTPKSVSLSADLVSRFALQTVCMAVAVTFEHFVLKIDFGDRLGLVYLAAILGGFLGVSLGFAVGSIGTMDAKLKQSISTSVIMSFCFLSGLMKGDMKIIIEEHVPVINRINPAAVISDCFHALNVYSDTKVYFTKILTMVIMTVFFSILGFIFTRRRKYASL